MTPLRDFKLILTTLEKAIKKLTDLLFLFALFIMFNLLPFGTESICHQCAPLHLNYCQWSALHLRPLSCLYNKSAWQKPQRRTCLWKKNFQATISLENFPQRSWRSLKCSQIQEQPFPNKAAVVWNTLSLSGFFFGLTSCYSSRISFRYQGVK